MKKIKLLTVFLDVSVNDLRFLFETHDQPMLVLNDEQRTLGLIEPKMFWKELALNKQIESISKLMCHSYKVYDSMEKVPEKDTLNYKYALIKKRHDYYLYTMKDLSLLKLEQEINSLENVRESLIKELTRSKDLTKELRQILNASYDEIYVTDANGNTLFVSDSCEKLTGLPPETYIGKNVKELVEQNLLVNSVTLRTMKTKVIHSAEQTYRNGLTVFSTAKPIFNEHGELYRIVTNSRDISELVAMKQELKRMSSSYQDRNLDNPELTEVFYCGGIITATENMLSVITLAKKIAKTDSSILIKGESGVGKGVLAKMIHRLSDRHQKNFIQVNCGAIPPSLIESELFGYEAGAFTGATKKGKKGLVEQAHKGTLFLDEISEMPLDMQVKLLQLVQDKTFMRVGGTKEISVDIRIISATNRDLKQMISDRTFREDLYYRLHVVPLTIPPLRERKDDILILIDYFLNYFNKKHNRSVSLDRSSKLFLQLHDYPGNIRELENLIEQIVVTASESALTIEELPLHFNQKDRVTQSGLLTLKEAVDLAEKQVLKQALETYQTTRDLARALEVSQTTIMRKLKKYNLSTK